jgi:integrase
VPRRGTRKRIARAIYEDATGRAGIYRDAHGKPRELRFPPATPITQIRAELERRRAAAKGSGRLETARGTLAEAVNQWEPLEQHLASWETRRAELRAWVALYGDVPVRSLTATHVRKALGIWTAKGWTAKTLRNYLWSLKHLCHVLYGKRTPTPVDDVAPPAKERRVPVLVTPDQILRVYQQLLIFEAKGRLRDAKTRARFMVRASTGRRPSEIRRALPGDVDLKRREWRVRDAKGGWSEGLHLNNDMLIAWKLFIKADAWGDFNTGSQAEVLRAAGWPAHSRPYDMRASTGITLSERGVDLADVGGWLGHTSLQTTRSAYVPILGGRMQRASQTLAGRFRGWKVAGVPTSVPRIGAYMRTQTPKTGQKSHRGARPRRPKKRSVYARKH